MMKDEFSFIRSIMPKQQHQSTLIQGIGDDAALFHHERDYETVVCIDTLVEDIHFSQATLTAYQIGYKALAVNLSDLAAMGAIPSYYLVSLAVPRNKWKETELHELFRGMSELSDTHKMDLIGGDTVSSNDALVITITAIGIVEKGRHLLRSNAIAGDLVFVTGTLGGSSAGLSLLLEKGLDYAYCEQEKLLIRQHQQPVPQIPAGRILAKLDCHVALNDVSDGTASEGYELAEASGKKVIIEYDKLPRHPSLQLFAENEIEQFLLYGGEDFQLIGCLPPSRWDEVKTQFSEAKLSITQIGSVQDGDMGIYLNKNGTIEKLEKRGFNHFSSHE